MTLTVRVVARAKRNAIEKINDTNYKVWCTAAPTDGKANEAVKKMIAKSFKIAPSRITLIHGATSRIKIISISLRQEQL